MKNFKEISRLEFYHDGGTKVLGVEVPYTRTWTLSAFDENDKLIVSVSDPESNNYIKYVKFIHALKMKAYKLRKKDREILKDEQRNDGFLQRSLIDRVTWQDIINITDIAGVSREHVHKLKSCDIEDMKEEKEIFAECIGLEYHELIEAIIRAKSA